MNTQFNPLQVLMKALCLFVIINILYALIDPQISKVSGYNVVFPGRTRLPFGVSGDPYTITVDNVDAVFASHTISASKTSNEFRVVLIGDSSVWGENLGAYEVISEQWNKLNIQCRDKTIKVYDLGYPHPSVIKDLVILDKVVEYDPDLIIWFVTLNTLISQRVNPFLVANQERVTKVLDTYDISFKGGRKLVKQEPDFFEKTLIGQRSNLARQIKLQMLGIVWTATGADTNTLAEEDMPDFSVGDSPRYQGMQPPDDIKDMLLFNALTAGHGIADPVPVLMVNEPIFISNGAVRYNIPYPRWAYDQYHEAMTRQIQNAQWNYLDLWNAIPSEYFFDAGLHLSASGERLLIEQINPTVQFIGCGQKP
ncbi:MAG TPA: hypothetical protein VF918_12345 [Anaerolineales bacterium]